MDFNLSEEQEILKRSARDFLKQEAPMKLVRDIVYNEKGYSPQLWQKMAALGWQGFILPSEYGGEDGSFLDVVVLLEEMGYALLPGPFIPAVRSWRTRSLRALAGPGPRRADHHCPDRSVTKSAGWL